MPTLPSPIAPAAEDEAFLESTGGIVAICVAIPLLIFTIAGLVLLVNRRNKRQRAARVHAQLQLVKDEIRQHDALVYQAVRSIPPFKFERPSAAATQATVAAEVDAEEGIEMKARAMTPSGRTASAASSAASSESGGLGNVWEGIKGMLSPTNSSSDDSTSREAKQANEFADVSAGDLYLDGRKNTTPPAAKPSAPACRGCGPATSSVSTVGDSSTLPECSICLTTLQEGDQIKTLACGHTFKAACIDQWLLGKGRPPTADPAKCRGLPTCPLCKREAVELAFPEHIAPPGAKLTTAAQLAPPAPGLIA